MSSETAAMRLDLIAAKAKQLADDTRNGRLWGGELSEGIGEIAKQLDALRSDDRVRRDR